MTQYNITANYTSRSDPFNGIKPPSALSLSLSLSLRGQSHTTRSIIVHSSLLLSLSL